MTLSSCKRICHALNLISHLLELRLSRTNVDLSCSLATEELADLPSLPKTSALLWFPASHLEPHLFDLTRTNTRARWLRNLL